MGLGIKEPRLRSARVPGTSVLFEQSSPASIHPEHSPSRNVELVLVPQPSRSPRDPLNWPLWKKDLTFFAICFTTALGAVISPALSTAGAEIVQEFKISFAQYALLSGWPLFSSGCAAWASQAAARVWGKRPVYLVGSLLLLATTIWSSRVTTYRGFLAARVLEGIGNGPFESIVLSSIGDMYFVHQRGLRIILYSMATFTTVNFSPIIGGYITQRHGWRTQFYIITGFLVIGLILLVFGCPEHVYQRPLKFETDVNGSAPLEAIKNDDLVVTEVTEEEASDKPKSYLEELKPFTFISGHENLLKILAQPLVCMLFPTVIWAFLLGGFWSAWDAGIAITLSQEFSGPPHLFSPSRLGYVFSFGAIGTVAAVVLGSLMADSTAKLAARHNKGLFEPEYRLWLLIPAFVVGIPGLFAFGNYAEKTDANWVVVSFLYGLITFATIFASAGAAAYVLDSHRDISVEVSVAYVMLRNFFWFGASYFLPNWLDKSGPAKVWDVVGGIQAGISVMAIAAYCFGKLSRELIDRHNPFRAL